MVSGTIVWLRGLLITVHRLNASALANVFQRMVPDTIFLPTGRRLALGLTAAACVVASGLTAMPVAVAGWVPITFGVVAGLLTVGLVIDLLRGR